MRYFCTADALCSLRPEAKFEMLYDDYDNLVWHTPEISIPTKEEVLQELQRLKDEEAKRQYQFDRLAAYPNFGEQMDILFHQGYDGWKAVIQEIKDKFPKPE